MVILHSIMQITAHSEPGSSYRTSRTAQEFQSVNLQQMWFCPDTPQSGSPSHLLEKLGYKSRWGTHQVNRGRHYLKMVLP